MSRCSAITRKGVQCTRNSTKGTPYCTQHQSISMLSTTSAPVAKPQTAPVAKPQTAPVAKPQTAPVAKPQTAPVIKPQEDRIKLPIYVHTMPAGRYFIGDPCYVISELDDDEDSDVFVERGTHYGTSGIGSDGIEYSVDSGTIGLVNDSLFDEDVEKLKRAENLGSFHTFTGPVTFTDDDSLFKIESPKDGFELTINGRCDE